MTATKVGRREDQILAGVAVFLVIDVLTLPWFDLSLGRLSVTNSATGARDGWLRLLGALSALALLVELALISFSATEVSAFGGGRANTRWLLAGPAVCSLRGSSCCSLPAQAQPRPPDRSRSPSKIGSS